MRLPVGAVIVLLLVGLLVGLAPVALASPPDQTWLPGLYDNADQDDAVLALTSSVAASDAGPAQVAAPTTDAHETLHTSQPSTAAPADRSPYHLRAPPIV